MPPMLLWLRTLIVQKEMHRPTFYSACRTSASKLTVVKFSWMLLLLPPVFFQYAPVSSCAVCTEGLATRQNPSKCKSQKPQVWQIDSNRVWRIMCRCYCSRCGMHVHYHFTGRFSLLMLKQRQWCIFCGEKERHIIPLVQALDLHDIDFKIFWAEQSMTPLELSRAHLRIDLLSLKHGYGPHWPTIK